MFEAHRQVSDSLVQKLDPQVGQTILELAAGPGETGFVVADRIGATGRLISTDVAAEMVAAARRGATERGLGNVEPRVMDAHQIDLPDASVDGVLCRFGLMLMPDPGRVVTEVRRVLSPTGRFVYSVFGPPQRNQWMTLLGTALAQCGHRMPGDPRGPGGAFSLCDPDRNRDLLSAAGFAEVEEEEIAGAMHFDSFEDYWNVQTQVSGRFASVIASLTDDETDLVRSTLRDIAGPYSRDGAYDLPTFAVVVSAR